MDDKAVEKLAHIIYLADVDYNGSGNRYEHLARSVIWAQEKAKTDADVRNVHGRAV